MVPEHPHFVTLKVNYLLQMDKHLLVNCSTLRNKLMVHDALPVEKDFHHPLPVSVTGNNTFCNS
jgi:hypothetical protein